MSASEHTPTPWEVHYSSENNPALVVHRYRDEQDRRCTAFLATCESATENNDANAAFIALACNSHDALVAERDELAAQSLAAYAARQEDWCSRTFGHGMRTLGVTRHIEKEIAEIRAKPMDLEEWIDVMILAMDGYWRHGGDPKHIMEHLQAKQDKNFARQWPTPQPEDIPVEHVREPVAERDALAAQVEALEAQRDLARDTLKEFLVDEGVHTLNELSAIRASHAELLKAATNLVDKIALTEKPINDCLVFCWARGYNYNGPHWNEEIIAISAAIARAEEIQRA